MRPCKCNRRSERRGALCNKKRRRQRSGERNNRYYTQKERAYIKQMLFLWILPLIFIVHDLEEIFIMQNWLKANADKLKPFLEKYRAARFSYKFLNVSK